MSRLFGFSPFSENLLENLYFKPILISAEITEGATERVYVPTVIRRTVNCLFHYAVHGSSSSSSERQLQRQIACDAHYSIEHTAGRTTPCRGRYQKCTRYRTRTLLNVRLTKMPARTQPLTFVFLSVLCGFTFTGLSRTLLNVVLM